MLLSEVATLFLLSLQQLCTPLRCPPRVSYGTHPNPTSISSHYILATLLAISARPEVDVRELPAIPWKEILAEGHDKVTSLETSNEVTREPGFITKPLIHLNIEQENTIKVYELTQPE